VVEAATTGIQLPYYFMHVATAGAAIVCSTADQVKALLTAHYQDTCMSQSNLHYSNNEACIPDQIYTTWTMRRAYGLQERGTIGRSHFDRSFL
jgi:hypothetical protein